MKGLIISLLCLFVQISLLLRNDTLIKITLFMFGLFFLLTFPGILTEAMNNSKHILIFYI